MPQSRYHIVFYGEIAAGQDLKTVKANLRKLFKLSEQQVDAFFTGKPIKIKNNVDSQTALQYQTAFEKVGAICRLEPISAENMPEPVLSPQIPENAKKDEQQAYNVVLTGEMIAGRNLAEVKTQLAALFKTDTSAIDRLFPGKPVVIKAQVSRQTALNYKTTLERAGAICRIEPNPSSSSGSPEAQETQPTQSATLPKCPKCGYQAKSPNDPLITGGGGLGECPNCGIIVAKYAKVAQQKAVIDDPETRKQSEAVLAVLKTYLSHNGLFVAPDIPPQKLLNAKQSCQLSPYERPIGLIDCTALGSAKNCLLFAMRGIYYHNDWTGKKPGNAMIPYRKFAGRLFTTAGQEVVLGEDLFLSCAGSSCSSQYVAEILNAIRGVLYPGQETSAVALQETTNPVPPEPATAVAEKKAGGGFFAPEKKGMEKGAIGGLTMMAIAVVWFVLGYRAGYIFFYPPILFVIGLFGFLKGLFTGNLKGEK